MLKFFFMFLPFYFALYISINVAFIGFGEWYDIFEALVFHILFATWSAWYTSAALVSKKPTHWKWGMNLGLLGIWLLFMIAVVTVGGAFRGIEVLFVVPIILVLVVMGITYVITQGIRRSLNKYLYVYIGSFLSGLYLYFLVDTVLRFYSI